MASVSDNEPGNALEITPATNKRRRKKSMVWEHFTVETVGSGCTRACCKQCKQTFAYSTGSKLAGTSHLKRHIAMGSCPKIKSQDKKQLTPYTPASSKTGTSGTTSNPPTKRRYRGGSSVLNMLFDQDRSVLDLARMLIIQEYPLHMVEHSAFITFVQNLQPRFRMPTFPEIEMECIAIYEKEKEQLMQLLGSLPGRIGLTLSLWTSRQTLGYMCLRGHFIDEDWKVHSRMLNFMNVSSPHTEMALSDAIGACLSDWNMKTRLFTVTVDNSRSSHDLYSANLRDHLSCNSSLMLDGRIFFVRCYAHILNTVARDALEAIHDIIYNVRESVKYVKASPAREERFSEIAEQLQITNAKTLLSLDVQNHWNTTYLMLMGALELKHVFASLELSEANYNEAPSMDDWKKVEIVCTYLRLLHDSAKLVSTTDHPTANIYFHEAWKIHYELSNAAAAEENLASEILRQMHEKFDKYWKDCSLVLAIAVVMDPRFKMKLVEFSFSKIYGQNAASYIKVVNDGIHELYQEYIAQPLPLTPAYFELPLALPVPPPPPPPSPPPEVNTVTTTMENHQENHDDNMIIDNINDNGKVDNNGMNNVDNANNKRTSEITSIESAVLEEAVTETVDTEMAITEEMVTEAGVTEEVVTEACVTEEVTATEEAVPEEATATEEAVFEGGAKEVVTATEEAVPEGGAKEVVTATEEAVPDGGAKEVVTATEEATPEGGAMEVATATEEAVPDGGATEVATATEEAVPDGGATEVVTATEEAAPEGGATEVATATEEAVPEGGAREVVTATEAAVPEAGSTQVAVTEAGSAPDVAVTEVALTEACVPEAMVTEVAAASATEAGGVAEVVGTETHVPDGMVTEALPEPEPAPPAIPPPSTPQPPPAPASLQLLTSSDGIMDIFEIYVSETTLAHQTKSELDQYLEEALVPRIQDFDILNWWKLNQLKYPTLCKMARDVLAIPFLTVTSGSVFATGNRVLDEYRSSLKPETVEALFCTKDWLEHAPLSDANVGEPSNALIKMET